MPAFAPKFRRQAKNIIQRLQRSAVWYGTVHLLADTAKQHHNDIFLLNYDETKSPVHYCSLLAL